MMTNHFKLSLKPADGKNEPAWWLLFFKGRLLVHLESEAPILPLVRRPEDLGYKPLEQIYLGRFNEAHCYGALLNDPGQVPAGMNFQDLRFLYGRLSPDFFPIAFRALHLLDWSQKNRFCGRCGGPITKQSGILGKECSSCGNVVFPKISPAVIVLVEREDQVLLASSPRFKDSFYSVLAGFVEPGETLEEVVVREVREETGIEVTDLHYFGSQPWPFPDSLMIGFTARYAGGEIRVDGDEILEARWFPFDQLPKIPGKISIARALIDWFVDKKKRE
ncbi:MAG TPA: NAD(+) diphosphatase, partial [Thermodesulfobacteriota bacterium]|nr:NAD(+) diphosphatase [Thermodesulfobacteriota bacterium]